MPQDFHVSGKVQLPFEAGQAAAPLDLTACFPFTQKADFDRSYSGAVTDDEVDLGPLAEEGARGLIVKCPIGTATIKFNGGDVAWPLGPGAYFLFVNPLAGFPKSAAISTIAAATVKFLAVG
jgi:hypothetical protein